MTAIDPDLVRVWIVPGEPFTYEVDAAGDYHIGGPEQPVGFEADGAVMTWASEVYDRLDGAGATPVGRWTERSTGAEWDFAADGSYTVTWDGEVDHGLWALRQGDTMLWTREWRAKLATNGAEVSFTVRDGTVSTYGYTVGAGVWTLFDPVSWAELTRYLDPAALSKGA